MAVKEQMLNVMYAEAIRNYESFEFVNKAATPSLMLIDSPFSPIKPIKKSNILYLVIFFNVFLIFALIGFRVNEFLKSLKHSL